MATNVNALKKRYKELVPGKTMTVEMRDVSEDLAIALSLAIKNQPVTPRAILIKKMNHRLEEMKDTDAFKPFAQAILEMYEQRSTSNSNSKE